MIISEFLGGLFNNTFETRHCLVSNLDWQQNNSSNTTGMNSKMIVTFVSRKEELVIKHIKRHIES